MTSFTEHGCSQFAHRSILDALQLEALAAALERARLEEGAGGGQRAGCPVRPLILIQQPIPT